MKRKKSLVYFCKISTTNYADKRMAVQRNFVMERQTSFWNAYIATKRI